ncbi:MAG: hypothetical protein Q9191_005200 [Dirinaria sp. TL-2023a]
MPRGNGKKRTSHPDDYVSDDGFVANASDASNAPKSKKVKITEARSKLPWGNNGDEPFWELSNKRRVNVSEFQGRNLVNIREMFEKDGEMLPGRKVVRPFAPVMASFYVLSPHMATIHGPIASELVLGARPSRYILQLANRVQGISLTIDQYNNLMLALPGIETALATAGENVKRPDYSGQPAAAEKEQESGPVVEGGTEDAKTEGKKNFEATSDEEE